MSEEQRKALLLVASGAPIETCLDALTDAVARLAPGTRGCVLLASDDRSVMEKGYSSHLPPSFTASIRGLPIGEALIGTCGAAIYQARPVLCSDIEHSLEWAEPWRRACLANDIRACYSHPAISPGGKAIGSFFLCLSQAREPDAWECSVAEFGALATSIVVERDRAAAQQRQELYALERLQSLSAELVGPGEFEPLLKKILAAAADISETDKGNIQIYDPVSKTLRIVVHQGLGMRLVEHFREDGWDASCGAAAKQVQRLVVADVEKLDALRGTLGLEIVLEDDIRSIQCTPLVSRQGHLLGMLNNHYRRAGGPSPSAMRYIDLLARQAAELIERHQVDLELALAHRRKEEFLAMLAHELRNPLAPLSNMLEVLKRSKGKAELEAQAQEVMGRQVSLLVRLVDDLLDVNRIHQGKLELRLEPLLLTPVLLQAIEVCRPLLDQQGHRLQLKDADAAVFLHGDAARLTQVFGNLLTNACKYTPPGGAIEIEVRPLADNVEVCVRDNGMGIPLDQLDSIFEVFTQVDRTLERAQGGLGIGLMLVKQLVEMHGGSVQARSEGLAKGSEFIVRLPSGATARPLAQGDVIASTPARRILVVDDNKDAARSLVMLLEIEGHEVRIAYSGAEALDAAAQMRPDVILMDIGMPGMNGYQTCSQIRAFDWGQRITMVALTGWGQDNDRWLSREAGFDAHLVKPLQFDALASILSELPGR